MRTPYLLFGLLALTASIGAGAAEKVYKWKDAQGVTHFSDAPPPKGTTFDNVQVRGEATITNANDPAAADKAAADAAAADTAKPDDKAKSESQARCDEARERLTLLESKTPLNTMQDGKQVELKGDARAAELNVARAQVQSYCAPPPTR